MEITPDHEKLASARIPPEELQTAFNVALMNAAAVDCGTALDPDAPRAEFGESVARNPAMAKRFAPDEVKTYRVVLVHLYKNSCKKIH